MIYMTTDEWKEISALITAHDFDKLATGIASRTYDLNISQEELDARVTGMKKVNKKEDPELRTLPNLTIQNDGLVCFMDFEDQSFKFKFEQPISHVAMNAYAGKRSPEEKELEEQLFRLENQILSLPNLIWDSKYHVIDKKATSKVCPEYNKLTEEYESLVDKIKELRHKF